MDRLLPANNSSSFHVPDHKILLTMHILDFQQKYELDLWPGGQETWSGQVY